MEYALLFLLGAFFLHTLVLDRISNKRQEKQMKIICARHIKIRYDYKKYFDLCHDYRQTETAIERLSSQIKERSKRLKTHKNHKQTVANIKEDYDLLMSFKRQLASLQEKIEKLPDYLVPSFEAVDFYWNTLDMDYPTKILEQCQKKYSLLLHKDK